MAWAATTVATDPARKDGQVISFPMADNITIFKGDMVVRAICATVWLILLLGARRVR